MENIKKNSIKNGLIAILCFIICGSGLVCSHGSTGNIPLFAKGLLLFGLFVSLPMALEGKTQINATLSGATVYKHGIFLLLCTLAADLATGTIGKQVGHAGQGVIYFAICAIMWRMWKEKNKLVQKDYRDKLRVKNYHPSSV